MTTEEKQLLLKDLCARLPYGVMVKECDGVIEQDNKLLDIDMFDSCINYDFIFDDIKPYLRPMSSMTEEEEKIYSQMWNLQDEYPTDADIQFKIDVFDWLIAHHFDYRGLIEKELALEAPANMYKTKFNVI